MAKNTERRMIPFGIDLNKIPKEELDSKALALVSDARPLAVIPPPKPRSYGQSYFAQPVLPEPPQPLMLEGAPLIKGPIITLLEGTKLLLPKPNETLLGVKRNKSGEIVCAKYTTRDHPYIEGVCAHPSKVRFVPPKEVPKHTLAASEAPPKRRKTIADLEIELQKQRETITSLESNWRFLSRCVLNMNEKIDGVERRSQKIGDRVTALEHLEN
jgi:hypothetical protein